VGKLANPERLGRSAERLAGSSPVTSIISKMELAIIIILALLCAFLAPLWYFSRIEYWTDYHLYKEIAKRRKLNWVEVADLSEAQIKWKTKQYNLPPDVAERIAFMIGTADSELSWFFDVDQGLLGVGFATYGTNGTAQFVPAGAGTFITLDDEQ
jgi:hypothetical protein